MSTNDCRPMRKALCLLATVTFFGVLLSSEVRVQASANLIVNGSFETANTTQAYPDVPSLVNYYLINDLPNWDKVSLTYFYLITGNGSVAQDGNGYVNFCTAGYSSDSSSISQNFQVAAGKPYRVSYYQAQEVGMGTGTVYYIPDYSVIRADISLAAGTAAGTVTQLANSGLEPTTKGNWTLYSFDFTPTATTTATLTFTKVFSPHVVLDNVSVVELPPPPPAGTVVKVQ